MATSWFISQQQQITAGGLNSTDSLNSTLQLLSICAEKTFCNLDTKKIPIKPLRTYVY